VRARMSSEVSGQADLRFAEFQAKLLTGPEPDDPVEDHMNAVLWLITWWTLVIVAIAGAVTWFSNQYAAAIVVLAVTFAWLTFTWPRRARRTDLPSSPG